MVQILLAAYNGAAYLAEQIESIRRQSYPDWRLLIRDDGSTDQTVDIVRDFAARDPRIELLADDRGRLGVLGNFAALAEAALERPACYVAFADQDDVWHPQKLDWQLACLAAAERDSPPDTPIAVHSDLAVVDAQLRPIHPSFLRYQGLWHETDRPLRTLVVQNFVTGCTLLFNRPLLELAVPIPPQALVHDWWLALCAAAAGRLEFLPQATVQYRQHAGNTIGAKRWWSPHSWPKLRQLASHRRSLADSLHQAKALVRRLEGRALAETTVPFMHDFTEGLNSSRGVWRLGRLYRLGVRRQGRLRNAVLAAQVWSQPAPMA